MRYETNEFGYKKMIPDPSIEGYEDIINTILDGVVAYMRGTCGDQDTYDMLAPVYAGKVVVIAVSKINENLPPEVPFKVNGRMIKGLVNTKMVEVREELKAVLEL